MFLAAGGYRALGDLAAAMPADQAFEAGMRTRTAMLADPPPDTWGAGAWKPGRPIPDAMILIGDDDPDAVTRDLEAVEKLLNGSGARVLGIERGVAYRRQQSGGNPKGEGIEHFGYVDGRSQPLFLQEDVDAEPGRVNWNPAFAPKQFIVADPNGKNPCPAAATLCFGSWNRMSLGSKPPKTNSAAVECWTMGSGPAPWWSDASRMVPQ